MALLFVLLVVVGFAFHFIATFPVQHASSAAWGCWLVASVIWALGHA